MGQKSGSGITQMISRRRDRIWCGCEQTILLDFAWTGPRDVSQGPCGTAFFLRAPAC